MIRIQHELGFFLLLMFSKYLVWAEQNKGMIP